jgi:hypothetical protein
MPTLKNDLKSVLDLIKDINHWCQYNIATDGEQSISPLSKNAVFFCLDGACRRVCRTRAESSRYNRLADALTKACLVLFGHPQYTEVNDGWRLPPENNDEEKIHIAHNNVLRIINRALNEN